MTQTDFAKAIGVNQSTVSRWERGLTSPNLVEIGLINKLAKKKRVRLKADWFLDPARLEQ